MRWLIISDDKIKIAHAKKLISILGKHDVFDYDLRLPSLEKVIPLLEACDHVLIFFDKDISSYELVRNILPFVAGYCSGKNILCLATGEKSVLSGFGITTECCFDDERRLFSYLEKSYHLLEKTFEREDAYAYLFKSGMPFTPDSFAAVISKDKMDLCEKYITAGMDVNSRTSEGTPMLNIAVRAEHMDCVNWLVDHGADINAVSEDRGYTAIMDAVWRGNKTLVEYFVNRGAVLDTISKEGQTMLVLAVGAGRADICKILSDHGEDPDIPDAMGMSAYGYAKLFKNNEIVAILEKNHKES